MTTEILRFDAAEVQPMLTAADIPFSPTGLSSAVVVDPADLVMLRLMLSESLTLAATLTARRQQDEVIVAQLRAALQTRRAA